MLANKQILMRVGLLLFMGLIGLSASGQGQQALRKSQERRMDSDWSMNRTIKNISNNRDTCEAWIRRLKKNQLLNENHKHQYLQVKQAYDVLLDQMIQDISGVNNIGEVIQFFASSNDRNREYQRQCMYADQLSIEFINACFQTLYGDTFGSPLHTINALFDFFVPGFVSEISNVFREAVKRYYIRKLNGLRLYGWEKVI